MISRLDQQIKSVCPIDGISGEQGSITVQFTPEATAEQRTAAQQIVDSFDWSDAAHAEWLENKKPARKELKTKAQAAVAANQAFIETRGSANAASVREQVAVLSEQQTNIINRLLELNNL